MSSPNPYHASLDTRTLGELSTKNRGGFFPPPQNLLHRRAARGQRFPHHDPPERRRQLLAPPRLARGGVGEGRGQRVEARPVADGVERREERDGQGSRRPLERF